LLRLYLLKFAGIQQKIKMNTKKTFLKFLFASIIVCFFTLENGYAQVAGVDPNNLGAVKVDEMTDAQILDILKQGQTAGLSVDQAAQLAIKKGLNPNEVDKFNARVAKLQNATPAAPTTAAAAAILPVATPEVAVIQKNEIKAANETATVGATVNEIPTPLAPTPTAPTPIAAPQPDKALGIYGQAYFRAGDIKIYNRSTDSKAPGNYTIGIGDEFGISVFGYSYYNEVLKVDARGAINPSNMGPVFVKGLSFDKAKGLIKAKMGQSFDLNNNKVEITLVYSRNITVNIVGEVIKPGSYNFPAINTAFNALILAGGPSDIGTLRNIQIKRGGKIIKSLDAYAFLNDANANQDFFLEENDYMVVGSSQKVVSIKGEVKRNASYELLANENLSDVLKYAGGYTANAYGKSIQIRRISNTEINLIDVNFDSLQKIKKDFVLMNGDDVVVRASLNEVLNKISISGAVNFAGTYNLVAGDNISKLLKKAGGLKLESNAEIAYLVRTLSNKTKVYYHLNLKDILANPASVQNMALEALDEVTIYSTKDFIDFFSISVSGAVRKPGNFEFVAGITLRDAIMNAGGLKKESIVEQAYLIRTKADLTKEYIRISLVDIMDSASKNNMLLQPIDAVVVYNKADYVDFFSVSVAGAVKKPGTFEFVAGITLRDAIMNAGGLKKESIVEQAYLIRTKADLTKEYIRISLVDIMDSASKNNRLLEPLDAVVVYNKADYVDYFTVQTFGALRKAGKQEYVAGLTLGDVLQNAGGLTLEASNLRIEITRLSMFTPGYKVGKEIRTTVQSIQLKDKQNVLNDADAKFPLQPYDQIFVRSIPNYEMPQIVEITGEVKYPGKYTLLKRDEKIASLIKRAGGLTRYAFPEAATFYRPSLPGNYIVIKLKKAIKFHSNRSNYLLKDGDVLNVPLTLDLVSIKGSGALNYTEINNVAQLNAPYLAGRRAGYYIRHYGSGFSDNAWRRKTYVVQPNSKINRTSRILFYPIYPKVSKGSIIYTVLKPQKVKAADKKKDGEPFDSNKFVEKLTTKITGLATLYILLRQVQ
jgi:protein involved in polysaccharide export with SLBB domain